MPLSFDPIAFFLAFFAIAATLYQLRRTYAVIVKVIEARESGGQSLDENHAQMFSSFELLIRNVGRPLHDVGITLGFRAPDGRGWFSIPLRHFAPFDLRGDEQHKGEFSTGMVGKFGLKSYQLDYGGWQMLSALTNAAEQCAVLTIYSQGYRVKQINLGVGTDLVKFRWNQFAWRINPMFNTFITPKGTKACLLKSGAIVPVLACVSFPITMFIRGLRGLPQPPTPPPIDPRFFQQHPFNINPPPRS
jgi:hypothetical protein